jgi:hypothetical protein
MRTHCTIQRMFSFFFFVISMTEVHRPAPRIPRGTYAPGKRWDYLPGLQEVGLSEGTVRLFTTEVTLNQTSGNWHHFIKPIYK